MTPACRDLFDYASRHVTPEVISDYCPSDPGYADYVREFTAILASRSPPPKAHFDITETIGLTRWHDPDRESDPMRFRRFRTFTNSVGVAMTAGPEGPDENMPANYFVISLLDDAHALQDSHLLQLLPPVFAELHQQTVKTEWFSGEAPFLLLGQLVLAFLGFAPGMDVIRLSEQLVSEACEHPGYATPEFLWDCTLYNQLHHRWKHFVALSFPRVHEDDSIVSLRDALLYSPK